MGIPIFPELVEKFVIKKRKRKKKDYPSFLTIPNCQIKSILWSIPKISSYSTGHNCCEMTSKQCDKNFRYPAQLFQLAKLKNYSKKITLGIRIK